MKKKKSASSSNSSSSDSSSFAGTLGGGGKSSTGIAKVIIKNEEAVIDMFKKKLGSKLNDMREKSLKIKTLSGKAEKKPESTFARMFNEKLAGKDKLIDADVQDFYLMTN